MVLVPPPIDPGQLTQCRRFEVPTAPAANSVRNFKSKSGTRIIALLVPLCFRSSWQSMLRRITNFGNGALVHALPGAVVGGDLDDHLLEDGVTKRLEVLRHDH